MSNRRLEVAQGLATAALALILIDVFGEGIMPNHETRAIIFATSGLMLSIGAFIVAAGQKSILISTLLVISGIFLAIDGLIVTRNLAVIYFPGPAIGFFLALLVLALGIAKSAVTVRAMRHKTAAAK